MRYLVTISDKNNDNIVKDIKNTGGIIEYKSIILPLLIIEHSNIEKIKMINGIVKIEPDSIGELEFPNIFEVRPNLNFNKLRPYINYENVKVAVIDSGVDNIGDINIIDGIDYTNTNTNSCKHGTAVASIINLVTPGVKLLSVKITDSSKVNISDAIKALEWAYLKGANVINLSLGFRVARCKGTCSICQIVEFLSQKNIVIVAAAGNDGPNLGTITCPGNSSAAFTIGAVHLNPNYIADFSGRGRYGQYKPDMVTSGYVYNKLAKGIPPEGGTSFAAPIISGISAGMFGIYNNSKIIKNILMKCTEKMNNYEYYDEGSGKLDINKLVEVLNYGKVANKN